MKKTLLCCVLSVIAMSVPTAYGKAQSYESSQSTLDANKFKFGPRVGTAIVSYKIGIFGEYQISEHLGLSTALLSFKDITCLLCENAQSLTEGESLLLIQHQYLSIPLHVRFYPSGESRQFCLYSGVQFNYASNGKIARCPAMDISSESAPDFLENCEKELKKSEATTKDMFTMAGMKSRKWGLHWLVGFDYEWRNGLQLGIEYAKETRAIITQKVSRKVIKTTIRSENPSITEEALETFVNTIKLKPMLTWTLHLTLGYNVAKLF